MNYWRRNVPENNGAFLLLLGLSEEFPERFVESHDVFRYRLFRVRYEISLIGKQKKILLAGVKGGKRTRCMSFSADSIKEES